MKRWLLENHPRWKRALGRDWWTLLNQLSFKLRALGILVDRDAGDEALDLDAAFGDALPNTRRNVLIQQHDLAGVLDSDLHPHMINKHIEQLNRSFGLALGFISDQPRFAWRWAPDLQRYSRGKDESAWTVHNWADELGKVWVLTRLRPPVVMLDVPGVRVGDCPEISITPEMWYRAFQGTRPFPGKLTPYVFAETALIPGLEPSAERTAFYIDSLREQMSKSVERLTQEGYAEIARARDAHKQEFFEMAADWFPFGWSSKSGAHTPGTRGGAVSFGNGT